MVRGWGCLDWFHVFSFPHVFLWLSPGVFLAWRGWGLVPAVRCCLLSFLWSLAWEEEGGVGEGVCVLLYAEGGGEEAPKEESRELSLAEKSRMFSQKHSVPVGAYRGCWYHGPRSVCFPPCSLGTGWGNGLQRFRVKRWGGFFPCDGSLAVGVGRRALLGRWKGRGAAKVERDRHDLTWEG